MRTPLLWVTHSKLYLFSYYYAHSAFGHLNSPLIRKNAISAHLVYVYTPLLGTRCSYILSRFDRAKTIFLRIERLYIISRMYVHLCDEWFRYIPRVAIKCQADEACLNKCAEYKFSLSRLFKRCHTQNLWGGWYFAI